MTLIFALTLSAQCFAQSPIPLWSKVYGNTNWDYTQSSIPTLNGGFIFIGTTQALSITSTDVWIVKTNAVGNIEWQRTYGGSKEENWAYSTIVQTADSGYVFTATTFSNNGDVVGNTDTINGNIWIVKISSAGVIQWQKCVGGSENDISTSIRQASDGSYFVSGTTNSIDGDFSDNHGYQDAFVIKLTSNGTLLWSKCYGGSNSESATKAILTSDGNLLIVGDSYSSDGDVPSNHGLMDGWVFLIDPSGMLVWSRIFGTSGFDVFCSALETSSSYLIVGLIADNSDDGWIVKLDKQGNFLSQKKLGGSNSDVIYDIVPTNQGRYLLVGSTSSNDGDVSGNHNTNGTPDGWAVEVDTLFNMKGQKCLGGTDYDVLFSVIKVGNDFLLTGVTYSNDGDIVGFHGGSDVWVVKLALVSIPLAIKDVHFTASLQRDLVRTTWSPIIEYSDYEVERSNDGIHWELKDKTITGRYDDRNPFTGISYYRLKAYKIDGKFEYSDIVKIFYHNVSIKVLSTITNATCTVSGLPANSVVLVFTLEGKLLFSKAAKGSMMDIDLSRYPSSIYIVKVGNDFTVEVVKQ